MFTTLFQQCYLELLIKKKKERQKEESNNEPTTAFVVLEQGQHVKVTECASHAPGDSREGETSHASVANGPSLGGAKPDWRGAGQALLLVKIVILFTI